MKEPLDERTIQRQYQEMRDMDRVWAMWPKAESIPVIGHRDDLPPDTVGVTAWRIVDPLTGRILGQADGPHAYVEAWHDAAESCHPIAS